MSVELISKEICQECEYMNIHTNTPPPHLRSSYLTVRTWNIYILDTNDYKSAYLNFLLVFMLWLLFAHKTGC